MTPEDEKVLEDWDRQVKKYAKGPVPVGLVGELGKAVFKISRFCSEMNQNNIKRNLRIDALEAQVKVLSEKQTGMKYRGVWQENTEYAEGNFCTLSGSVWHANTASKGVRPGNSAAWTLAVKAGKDAR